MSVFDHARLLLSVAELNQLPPAAGREVAFAGRSNAGKSSAINALTRRRRLAYVAREPGKTRTIQWYELAPERFLVDLPGYGYARVSESLRRQWGRLVDGYLAQRESLQGLVLIMDVRHPLTPLDQHLLAWFAPRRLPVHMLLSKADKISRNQALASLRRVEQWASGAGIAISAQLFSSLTGAGVDAARAVIARWLELPIPDPVSKTTDPVTKTTDPVSKTANPVTRTTDLVKKMPDSGKEGTDLIKKATGPLERSRHRVEKAPDPER